MPDSPTSVFRLELGINLRAARISHTRPHQRLFPLQNALIDVTREGEAEPSWFTRLGAGDEMSFRLVDITDLRRPQSPAPHPALANFHFTDPNSGVRANPFVERISKWRISQQEVYRWSPAYSLGRSQRLPTWDIWAETVEGEKAELVLAEVENGFRAFELSVSLAVERHRRIDRFVFDPEMIVCETGGSQGCRL